MKFPSRFDHQSDRSSSDVPDVTSGVLDRLGISDDVSSSEVSGGQAVRQVYRYRFVVVLGGIVMASILWRSLTPSGDSIDLVEQFPQTIQEGRENRAQLLMGFMAPFEKVDRAISEVGMGAGSSALTGVSDSIGSFDNAAERGNHGRRSSPSEMDILEATAPFPSS